jgi:hypothetical protein
MDKKAFEQTIYKNWTDSFGCPLASAWQSGTTLSSGEKLKEVKVVALAYIGKHTFVEYDAAIEEEIKLVINNLPANKSLSGDDFQRLWGSTRIKARDMVHVHYLYPPDLPDFSPPSGFSLRQLSIEDSNAMEVLHNFNSKEEVDSGYVEVTHQVAFGCFAGEQMVAAASGYERTGFLDIGVLTHPQFRRLGLGKAVVGAICEWSVENNMIAQYRYDVENRGSQRVAESLNFQFYFKQESIWLV